VVFGGLIAAILTVAAAACGGGSSPTGPSAPGPGTSGPVGATLTITSAGTNNATVSVGQSVTIVNNDSRTHNINSDPHPVHTSCPALNVGILSPGQSKTSGAFTAAGTCGFHDHDDPDNARWTAQITVR
jgi:plastocyanin